MKRILLALFTFVFVTVCVAQQQPAKTRVIVTSDGEVDDECSMVRFLLYTNEFDVEGIVTSSSQYHWHGHKWAGDDWMNPYLDAYEKVYPNLVKHDKAYPTPQHLRQRTVLGNVRLEGEMDDVTAGSQLIVKVLLDESDKRPVWLQAWGGTNTIARALKTIQQERPERMAEVAQKIRLLLIWEQDSTYQSYIRPHWGKYNMLTIISDQFEAIAYRWKNTQPREKHPYFSAPWMKENILYNHGALCSLYKAHVKGEAGFEEGDFRSKGDSPAFMHAIPTGLRNLENPGWGGWGGRYVKVRQNTWYDPVPEKGYVYPEGRWHGSNGWGRLSSKKGVTVENDSNHRAYFEPIWRWSDAFQNDFAARADWCVKSYKEANHPPEVKLASGSYVSTRPGTTIQLSATGTFDPDGNQLTYRWWQYREAGSYQGTITIRNANSPGASFSVPAGSGKGETHLICEVKDNGIPKLTRYGRVVVRVQ